MLLQRAARGRDELELRRRDEAGKRGNRFRCMVQVSAGLEGGPCESWQARSSGLCTRSVLAVLLPGTGLCMAHKAGGTQQDAAPRLYW